MSKQRVKGTGWVARNYNGRGLITHNLVTRNLLRTTGGVLWAVLRENIQNKNMRLYRSLNGGFTWDVMWQGTFIQPGFRSQGIAGLNTNGPVAQMFLDERRNKMMVLVSCWNAANSKYQIEPFLFRLDITDYMERILPLNPTTGAVLPDLVLINNDMDELAFSATQNDDFTFITHTQNSKLKLIVCRLDEPVAITENMPDAPGTSYFNLHDSVVDDNDKLHIAILDDRGSSCALVYNRYEKASNSWASPSNIVEFPKEDTTDINIVRAPDGRLTVLWGQHLDGGNQVTPRYSHSKDGVSWSLPVDITTASAQDFKDVATQQLATRLSALQTLEGDLYVTYVTVVNDIDTCHYKKLTWKEDHYEQGPETLVSSYSSGAKFFRPTSTNLVSGDDPDNIRIGYVLGQGNSPNQLDTVPIKIRQKTLLQDIEIDVDAYEDDTPAKNQLPIFFNLLGAPNDNIDFYAAGVVGPTTSKYIGAFNRIGTAIRLIRWEPDPASYLEDKTAFYKVAEYSAQALFDANNYEFPQVTGMESFKTYIERDTRKLFLPPTFHLDRTFVLNQGEFLKRTVWTCLFDGNEYELSQVIPFFYDNQIAYYTANAYVIGPSNDPFARRVLPSET